MTCSSVKVMLTVLGTLVMSVFVTINDVNSV